MKSLITLIVLISFLFSTEAKANIIYKQLQELNLTEYSIKNPVGVQDINIKVKKEVTNRLIINTNDYLESVVLTKNFDELLYLECSDVIDKTQNYNVDGNEYDLGKIKGEEIIVGFRFPTVGNSFHYAWMKLKIDNDGETFDFVEYAYEDFIDMKIGACDIGFVATISVAPMSIYIYPNPAQDYIRVSCKGNTIWTSAEVVSSKGTLQKRVDAKNEIYVGDLTKGMYQILCYDKNRIIATINFLKI